jgi:hypothetical protein
MGNQNEIHFDTVLKTRTTEQHSVDIPFYRTHDTVVKEKPGGLYENAKPQ